jgi:hypothetical protein
MVAIIIIRYAYLLLEYIPSEKISPLLLVRSELPTAITMKYAVFWIVTPRSLETVKRF